MAKQAGKSDVSTHKDDPILSPNEVGKMIGKSGFTVRNWIRDGLLQAIKFPGSPGRFGIRRSEAIKLISNSALAEKVKRDGD